MISNFFNLTQSQKLLFFSAMTAIFFQILCIYCLLENKNKFKIDKCIGYFIFSGLAYISYYQMII
jgi:hypothetical protein